jgi:hypothetical protein
MDQKRRKFLIKQNRKRKDKLRKLNGGVKKAAPASIDVARFKRADKFVGCEEALDQYFVPADGVMYRVVHDPMQKNDELVQNEQEFEGIANTRSDLPMTIAPNSPLEEQYEHLKENSLSFSLDKEKLAEWYWNNYDGRRTTAAKEKFETRIGTVIAKYNMVPEVGVMQREADPNGHLVIAEYVDVNLDDFRDKEFGLKPLTDYKHEKE